MLLPRLLQCPKLGRLTALGKTPFELRFNMHYCFIPLAVALCIHAERLLILTLVATCAWLSDYTYQVVFRTFRLDVVEFTRLKDGGVQARDRSRDSNGTSPSYHSHTPHPELSTVPSQVLWANPKGFTPNSGEFVKIQIPWLALP